MMNATRPNPASTAPSQDGGAGRGSPFLVALGLLAVAVVSGFVWWLIRQDQVPQEPAGAGLPRQTQPETTESDPTTTTSKSPTPEPVEAGGFTYSPVSAPEVSDQCDKVSYGKVSAWFSGHPCDEVVRGLYTTRQGDARAAVAISVVTMPDVGQAEQLKSMTDTSGTGNVSDLLRDGSVELPGAPKVAGGSYASNRAGKRVTIVEAAFFSGTGDGNLLDEITGQALRIAPEITVN